MTCLTVDKSERVWVGRKQGGLTVWDGRNWHNLTERDCSLLYGEIQSLMIDEFDNVWVGTAGGFAVLDGGGWHDWGIIRPGSTERPIGRKDFLRVDSEKTSKHVYIGSYVTVDGLGRKWMCAPRGIVMFSPQDNE